MKNYKWVIAAFLFLLGMINYADKAIIGYAAVPIMNDLNLDAVQWGLVGSSFFWFFSVSGILVGLLSDRVGSKKVISSMSAIWAAVQFSTVYVASLPALMATRIALGIGEGPSYSQTLNLASKWFPPKERGLGFGVVTFGTTLGPALFAPILITIILTYGWRTAFALMGVIGVIFLILWQILGREGPEEAIIMENQAQEPKKKVPLSKAIPIVCNRHFIFTALAGFACYWTWTTLIVWVPAYYVNARFLEQADLKWIMAVTWFCMAVTQLIIGAVSDVIYRRTESSRISRVYILAAAMVLSAACFYIVTIIQSTSAAILFLTLAVSCASAGFAISGTIVSSITPRELIGTTQGINISTQALAGLIAPVVAGSFVKNALTPVAGYNSAFLVTTVVMLVAAIAFFAFVKPDSANVEVKPLTTTTGA